MVYKRGKVYFDGKVYDSCQHAATALGVSRAYINKCVNEAQNLEAYYVDHPKNIIVSDNVVRRHGARGQPIIFNGKFYESVEEASRMTGHARIYIQDRVAMKLNGCFSLLGTGVVIDGVLYVGLYDGIEGYFKKTSKVIAPKDFWNEVTNGTPDWGLASADMTAPKTYFCLHGKTIATMKDGLIYKTPGTTAMFLEIGYTDELFQKDVDQILEAGGKQRKIKRTKSQRIEFEVIINGEKCGPFASALEASKSLGMTYNEINRRFKEAKAAYR